MLTPTEKCSNEHIVFVNILFLRGSDLKFDLASLLVRIVVSSVDMCKDALFGIR